VRRWPVREGLLAYRAHLRTITRRRYELECLLHAAEQLMYVEGGLSSKPKAPKPATQFE